jgi:hypothetical protein
VKDTHAIAETMGEAAAQNSDESQPELLAQGHHLLVIGFDELAAKLSMLPVDEVTDVRTRPPAYSRESSTVTAAPADASSWAADSPASPAPATTTRTPRTTARAATQMPHIIA